MVSLALVTAATAKTVTIDFAATNSLGWSSSLSYAAGGLSLKVSGGDTLGRAGQVRTWKGAGLGLKSVTDCRMAGECADGDAQIDATGRQDVVGLSFSRPVRIMGLRFTQADMFDTFDLYLNGARQFQAAATPIATLATGFGEEFGIGAGRSGREVCNPPHVKLGGPVCRTVWTFSAFKLAAITVETASVPLPATGLVLSAALGAVAALRRRRRR